MDSQESACVRRAVYIDVRGCRTSSGIDSDDRQKEKKRKNTCWTTMSERGGGEGSSSSPGKKARKPYTITRPRERWSPEEHERFLDALLRSVQCSAIPLIHEFPLLCYALFSASLKL
jgi:hypothetical protein